MTIKPSDESLKQGRNRSWEAVLNHIHPLHNLEVLYYHSNRNLTKSICVNIYKNENEVIVISIILMEIYKHLSIYTLEMLIIC